MSSAASGTIKAPYELLGMETALLIGTSATRNIDVSIWFNEKANDGKIPLREFDSKLISLASTMGIGQDSETKQELELAVSPLSLTVVHKLCNAGDDEHGNQLIDVTYLFKISQQKIDKYLSEVGGDDFEMEEVEGPAKYSVKEETVENHTSQENFRDWKEGSYDIFGNLIEETATVSQKPEKPTFSTTTTTTTTSNITNSVSRNSNVDQEEDDDDGEEEEDSDFVRISAEDYMKEIQAISQQTRPGSAPAGLTGGIRDTSSSRGGSVSTPESSRKSSIIPSPNQRSPSSASGSALKIDIKMPTNTTTGSSNIISSLPSKSGGNNTPLNVLGSPYDEVMDVDYEEEGSDEDIVVHNGKMQDRKSRSNHSQHQRSSNHRYSRTTEEEDFVRLQASSSPDPTRGNKVGKQVTEVKQDSPTKRAAKQNAKPHSSPQKASDRVRDWNAENHQFLMASNHISQHQMQQKQHQSSQQEPTTIHSGTHTRIRSNSTGAAGMSSRPKSAERPRSSSGSRREKAPSYLQSTASSAGHASVHVTIGTNNSRSSTPTPAQTRSGSDTKRRSSFSGFSRSRSVSSPQPQRRDDQDEQEHAGKLNDSFGTAGTGSNPGHHNPRRSIATTATGASVTAWHQHLQHTALHSQDMSYHKDIVEDLIREVVKKTDRYHLIQVYCGFLENYTFHPPRGPVIRSTPREYLSFREIHTAFLAARLFLNDIQLKALSMLVVEFAKLYRTVYVERLKQMIHLPKEVENEDLLALDDSQLPDDVKELQRESKLLPKRVKGRGGQSVASIWLEKYLLHLRLSKRSTSRSDKLKNSVESSNGGVRSSRTGSATRASKSSLPGEENDKVADVDAPEQGNNPEKEKQYPTPWKEWLTKKFQEEIITGSKSKPKELQRALTGQPHNITKDDLEYLLKQYPILSSEALAQEIEYRLESWIYDFDGRRDFQHQLNMRIQTWIWEEQILTKKVKGVPKNKSGYQKIWERLPKEEQVATKGQLISMLVAEKREELKSSERTKHEISKSLFTAYEDLKKSRAGSSGASMTWKDWLVSHFQKSAQTIEKMKQQEEERHLVAQRQKKRKNSLASLLAVENHLKSLVNTLDTHHQIQLQKGIVALRRAARERGIEAGTVVCKEDFDMIFKPILTPYVNFNETFLDTRETVYHAEEAGLQAASTLTQLQFEDWKKKLLANFHQDVAQIAKQVIDDFDQLQLKNKKSFDDWLAEKKVRDEMLRRAKMEEEEKKKQDAEMKALKSQKAFKKWLKLRKQAKYKSHVDKKFHDVPANRRVDHPSKWWVNNTAKGGEDEDFDED